MENNIVLFFLLAFERIVYNSLEGCLSTLTTTFSPKTFRNLIRISNFAINTEALGNFESTVNTDLPYVLLRCKQCQRNVNAD